MRLTVLVAVLVPVPMRVNVNLFSLECIRWRVVVYELLTYVWIQHAFAVIYIANRCWIPVACSLTFTCIANTTGSYLVCVICMQLCVSVSI